MASVSLCRQNYHQDCEISINKQINMELHASYTYLSMAFYFDRDDVALHNFYEFFKKMSDEERDHAKKLMEFQNKRGGRLVLKDIQKPVRDEWGSPLDAMQQALELEKAVNASLLEMHVVGARHSDPHFTDFIEEEFLREQVESIKAISCHITNLKRVGNGLGEYMFDKESLGS
uniref:Ferritin n=1 Tax=Romanomermis culicivorax TaxID=13658 RepID=A0A915JSG3_ROMCU